MGRPSNTVSDRELAEFCISAKNTPRLQHPHRAGAADPQRRATVWGLHQFDPVAIWSALKGEPPPAGDKMHQKGSWDVMRLVQEFSKIAADTSVDAKGKPVTPPSAKLQALKELRQFHKLIAAVHPEFLEETGRKVPHVLDDRETDPVILSMRRAGIE